MCRHFAWHWGLLWVGSTKFSTPQKVQQLVGQIRQLLGTFHDGYFWDSRSHKICNVQAVWIFGQELRCVLAIPADGLENGSSCIAISVLSLWSSCPAGGFRAWVLQPARFINRRLAIHQTVVVVINPPPSSVCRVAFSACVAVPLALFNVVKTTHFCTSRSWPMPHGGSCQSQSPNHWCTWYVAKKRQNKFWTKWA